MYPHSLCHQILGGPWWSTPSTTANVRFYLEILTIVAAPAPKSSVEPGFPNLDRWQFCNLCIIVFYSFVRLNSDATAVEGER